MGGGGGRGNRAARAAGAAQIRRNNIVVVGNSRYKVMRGGQRPTLRPVRARSSNRDIRVDRNLIRAAG